MSILIDRLLDGEDVEVKPRLWKRIKDSIRVLRSKAFVVHYGR